MKKNYNNKNNRENREGRDNRDRKRYNNDNHSKKFTNQKEGVVKKSDFHKNPSAFLVISLIIKANTSFQSVVSSIEAAVSVEHKKKVVISFENQNDKSFISQVRKRFEGVFGIFFYTSKAKKISVLELHKEVLHAFKSGFFLMLDANVVLRSFSLEKMITFLSKPGDVLAISPKFYDASQNIIHGCKRFYSVKDFISNSQKRIDEHLMMERGEVGYYSIHRIDYGSLDCMLFLTDALLKVKCFPKFKNQDLQDAIFCNKFSKKTKGKIMFYPHSRVSSNKAEEVKPSIFEKIKYIISNAF